MKKFTDIVTDVHGEAINLATVTVKSYPSSGAVTIYSDDGTTVVSGSVVTTDSTGTFSFYAPPGRYNLEVRVAGALLKTVQDVQIDEGTVEEVGTIAAMRALNGMVANQICQVLGYYSAGDGGGGPPRFWSASSTATHNGGSVIRPDSVSASDPGRWLWDWSGAFNVRWFGAKGDGVTDDTAAIQAATNTGKPVFLPYGDYVVAGALTLNSNLHGEGADTNQTSITLTASGQLLTGDTDIRFTGGFKVKTSVNNKTMVKVAHSRFYGDFALNGEGGATGLVGIEWATGTGLYHCAWVGAEIRDIATPFKITGTEAFNNNQLGADHSNILNFTSALNAAATGSAAVVTANTFRGYYETGTNFIINNGTVADKIRQNEISAYLDAVTNSLNGAGAGVGVNHWTTIKPGDFTQTGTVDYQEFLRKIRFRVSRNNDQTIADAAEEKIQFDTETFDPDAAFDSTTNYRFVAPVKGRYQFYAQASLTTNLADQDRIFIHLYKNGASQARRDNWLSAGNGGTINISDTIELSKNDYVEVFVRGDQAAANDAHAISGGATITFFAGVLL